MCMAVLLLALQASRCGWALVVLHPGDYANLMELNGGLQSSLVGTKKQRPVAQM
jgi:hypothetical protein